MGKLGCHYIYKLFWKIKLTPLIQASCSGTSPLITLSLTQPRVVLFMFKLNSNPDKLSKLDIDG